MARALRSSPSRSRQEGEQQHGQDARATAGETPAVRRGWLLWLAGSLAAIVTGLAVAWLLRRPVETPAELTERQLTANPLEGYVARSAISSDGKYVAYVDQTGLYLRSIESGETRAVSVPTELRSRIFGIRWFPEGGKLVAVAGSSEGFDLWAITILGEAVPRLLYRHGASPALSPDGRLIAFQSYEFGERSSQLLVGGINGELPRKLVTGQGDEDVSSPVWSPDGRWIAYYRVWKTAQSSWSSAIEVRLADGGPPKTLVSESSLPKSSSFDCASLCFAWSPDWRLVFPVSQASGSPTKHATHGLWAIRVEPQKVKAASKPERLVQTGVFVPRDLTITADGNRLSFRKELTWDDVYLAELGPDGASMKLSRRFTLDNRGSYRDDWTRDSQAILFSSERNGKSQVFKQGLKETVPEAVVESPGDDYGARISPDGFWLLYGESPAATPNARSSPVRLMRRPIGGGAPEMVLEEHSGAQWDFNCPAKPGSSCVLRQKEEKDYVLYSLDPLRGKGQQLGKIEVSYGTGWNISPDRSRLALVDPHKYHGRIEVLTLRDHSWQELSTEPGWGDFQSIAWAADGEGCLSAGSSVSWWAASPDLVTHALWRRSNTDGWPITRLARQVRCADRYCCDAAFRSPYGLHANGNHRRDCGGRHRSYWRVSPQRHGHCYQSRYWGGAHHHYRHRRALCCLPTDLRGVQGLRTGERIPHRGTGTHHS